MLLEDRVVLLTGGASGIGRAAAQAYIREGAIVVLADQNEMGLQQTTSELETLSGRVTALTADVTSAESVQAMITTTLSQHGRLDILVNSAGISGSMTARLHEVDDDLFERVMAVNVRGTWLTMKYTLPIMMQAGHGSVINLASVAGLIGSPKGAAYSASKHAVIGLTRTAALEYAKFNIRINAICPSYVDTPMVREITDNNPQMEQLTQFASPMKRLGRPGEVAEAIIWLSSDAASFVNGITLPVDGGLTAM